jgi:16S rRNA (cytosine967-C5)-methyltransferase
MKTGARIAAAIEIVADISSRHRPASEALSDWGKTHRFAGSGDRAAIGNLVFDVLRRRTSRAAIMGADTPRAVVLASAAEALGVLPDDLASHVDGSQHAPSPLTAEEAAALARGLPDDAPPYVRADVPEWMAPSFARAFGDGWVNEGVALATRAPVDLRVNRLKAERDKVIRTFAADGAVATPFAPWGVRLPARAGAARTPNVEADPAHGKGWFEVQDEGSQIAAALAAAGPRLQVMDLCAGAGGKTLALAAEMQNTGQIYAYDSDKHQLRPIFERLKRAGVRNAQVLAPGNAGELEALAGRFDVVFVDAPCTGSGVWRRRPDSKWRVRPESLVRRMEEQRAVLDLARPLVKPGGRLAYVTCSVLPEENIDQVDAFLARAPDFRVEPWTEAWRRQLGSEPVATATNGTTLQLSPGRHGTDGFFVAILVRA